MNQLSKLQSEAVKELIQKILVAIFKEEADDPDWTDKPEVVKKLEPIIADQIQKAVEETRKEDKKKFNKYCEDCVLYETKQILSIQSKRR
jgi:hypothetical protein